MPASSSARIASGESVAGPSVQTMRARGSGVLLVGGLEAVV
jgi:hypothetical protein